MERPIWRLCGWRCWGQGFIPSPAAPPRQPAGNGPVHVFMLRGVPMLLLFLCLIYGTYFSARKKRGYGAQPHIGNKQARLNFPKKQDYMACALGS